MKSEQLTANKMKSKHNVLDGSIQGGEFLTTTTIATMLTITTSITPIKNKVKQKRDEEKTHSIPFDFIFICLMQCNQD